MQAAIGERHLSKGGPDIPWTSIEAAQSRIEAMLAADSNDAAILTRYQSYVGTYQPAAKVMVSASRR